MFLKNYTSDVPVSVTIGRIEKVLISCGVSGIAKEYGPQGEVAAMVFSIKLDGIKPLTIRLPADKDAAQEALWKDYAGDDLLPDGKLKWCSRKQKKRASFADQAERTAWKLMQDWVEVQLSLIQMKQADFVQVFLPYVWDGKQTFYQGLRESGFLALTNGEK